MTSADRPVPPARSPPPPEIPETRQYDRVPTHAWILGGIMLVVAVTTIVLMLGDFSSQSYVYLLFYAIPANSAISIFPIEPVIIYFGKVGSMWLVAAAATIGNLAAGLLDHSVFVPVLNLSSIQGYKWKRWYRKTMRYFMRFPFATLWAVGLLPLPFFPLKFLAFSIHYPLWKYMAALTLSRYPKYLLLAWVGASIQIPDWLLFALFGAVLGAYAVKAGPPVLRRLLENRNRSS